MAKSRHRDNGGKRFHARRGMSAAPPPQEPEPWGLTEQNARSIARISAAGGMHPNQVLNELVAMALASSRVLHAQLAFGAALSQPLAPAAAGAPGPTAAPDADDIDTRSAEERLAARRDVAAGKGEAPNPEAVAAAGLNYAARREIEVFRLEREDDLADGEFLEFQNADGEVLHVSENTAHAPAECGTGCTFWDPATGQPVRYEVGTTDPALHGTAETSNLPTPMARGTSEDAEREATADDGPRPE